MSKSIIDKKERDKDFSKIADPEKIEDEKIVLERPIYHNGRQYIVKIPKEIARSMDYKKGDMIKYTLTISAGEEPKLLIEYIKK